MVEYYTLELHWNKIEKRDGVCVLYNSYFTGPALQIAQKINYPDRIVLDLTPQYSKILTLHYFVELSWQEVEYKEDKVLLKNVQLKGDLVNDISKLSKKDYIKIDTSKHEENIHVYNLVYKSEIVNAEGEKH